jgi:hypothetical protein
METHDAITAEKRNRRLLLWRERRAERYYQYVPHFDLGTSPF